MLTATQLLSWPYPADPASVAVCCVHLGQPVPKERARVVLRPGGKARGVTPGRTRAYEESLRLLLRAETRLRPADGVSRFAVRCRFYRRGRGGVDVDNLLKAVLDAGQAVYGNDRQVAEVHAQLFLGAGVPRTEILMHRVEG